MSRSQLKHGLSSSLNVKPGTFSSMLEGGGLQSIEINKLQNEIKVRDRELEASRRELTTMKSTIASNERLLQQRASEMDRLKERTLKAEQQSATATKESSLLKLEKRKLDSAVSDLQRQNDKLKEKVAQLGNKGPAFNEQVASLQSEVKLLKAHNSHLSEDHKAACSMIRAKDKELDVARQQLKAAAAVEARVHTLENDLAAAKKQLAQEADEIRTLQQVVRVKDTDIAQLNKNMALVKDQLDKSNQELHSTRAALKASEVKSAELSTELGIVRDELARATAVASRAAAAEAKIVKADGMVPAGQHMEEMKYLSSQINMLRDKLALAERDITVAHAIKEKYRSALEAANISIGELDAVADAAAAAAADAEPTTAAVRTAVRRSLGGSSAHQLLGLPIPPSPTAAGAVRAPSPVLMSPEAQSLQACNSAAVKRAAGTPPSHNKHVSRCSSAADADDGSKSLDQELAALQITEAQEQQQCEEVVGCAVDQATHAAGMTSDSGAQSRAAAAGGGKKRKTKKGKEVTAVALDQTHPACADAVDTCADADAGHDHVADMCELDDKVQTAASKSSSRSRRIGKSTTVDQTTTAAPLAVDSKVAEQTAATRRSTRRTRKDQAEVDGLDS